MNISWVAPLILRSKKIIDDGKMDLAEVHRRLNIFKDYLDYIHDNSKTITIYVLDSQHVIKPDHVAAELGITKEDAKATIDMFLSFDDVETRVQLND